MKLTDCGRGLVQEEMKLEIEHLGVEVEIVLEADLCSFINEWRWAAYKDCDATLATIANIRKDCW